MRSPIFTPRTIPMTAQTPAGMIALQRDLAALCPTNALLPGLGVVQHPRNIPTHWRAATPPHLHPRAMHPALQRGWSLLTTPDATFLLPPAAHLAVWCGEASYDTLAASDIVPADRTALFPPALAQHLGAESLIARFEQLLSTDADVLPATHASCDDILGQGGALIFLHDTVRLCPAAWLEKVGLPPSTHSTHARLEQSPGSKHWQMRMIQNGDSGELLPILRDCPAFT